MIEDPATTDRDFRAARFLAALIDARGLSPEDVAQRAGVGATTVRNALNGVIPQKQTRMRLATFFGVDDYRDIWRRDRVQKKHKRPAGAKALAAIGVAVDDPHVLRVRRELPDGSDFTFGIAWAVVRAGSPYATPDVVAERAAVATREWIGNGNRRPARAR